MSENNKNYVGIGDIESANVQEQLLNSNIGANTGQKSYKRPSIVGLCCCLLSIVLFIGIFGQNQKLEWIETELGYKDKNYHFIFKNNNLIFPYSLQNSAIKQHYYYCERNSSCDWVESNSIPISIDNIVAPNSDIDIKVHTNDTNPYMVYMIRDCGLGELIFYYSIDRIHSPYYGC